ncbi:MAG TPA: hypothetical protein VK453_03865 [Micromonosporaceae bacterium]|nr:hypothetical protein [Micromonosporaceae bacterium]
MRPRIAQHVPRALPEIDEAVRLLQLPDFFDFAFATAICWGTKVRS